MPAICPVDPTWCYQGGKRSFSSTAAFGIGIRDASAPEHPNLTKPFGAGNLEKTFAATQRITTNWSGKAGKSWFFGSAKCVALNNHSPLLDRTLSSDGEKTMREIISEARLRDEISARMNANPTFGSGTFWARPVGCKRVGAGPNWRYSFNPAAVPAGYSEAWERIRPSLESRYDLAE